MYLISYKTISINDYDDKYEIVFVMTGECSWYILNYPSINNELKAIIDSMSKYSQLSYGSIYNYIRSLDRQRSESRLLQQTLSKL